MGHPLGHARILRGNKNCASQTRPGRIISGRWRLRSAGKLAGSLDHLIKRRLGFAALFQDDGDCGPPANWPAVWITLSNAGLGLPARSNNSGWLLRPRTGQAFRLEE